LAKAIKTPPEPEDWRQTNKQEGPEKPPLNQEDDENTNSWGAPRLTPLPKKAPRLTPPPKPEEDDSATRKQRSGAKVTHDTEQSVKDTPTQKPMDSQLLVTLTTEKQSAS
jgi:hypothetical protein